MHALDRRRLIAALISTHDAHPAPNRILGQSNSFGQVRFKYKAESSLRTHATYSRAKFGSQCRVLDLVQKDVELVSH
jgi:hypothetical protein